MDNTTYVNAIASVLFISFAPVVLLLVLPIDSQVRIKKLLALAAGCLLGDAFLHLIPESIGQLESQTTHHSHTQHDHHDHDHHHEHHHHDHSDHHHEHNHDNRIGLMVLCGIFTFFVMEKVIYAIRFNPKHQAKKNKQNEQLKKKKDDDYKNHDHDHDHIHAAGILNLIADFLHNFTDGLAIGGSFLAGSKLGISTSFAIFLHEIPHEISDYAILIQSGFSKKKAILLQCVTAFGAISGTALALFLGSRDDKANVWILPFTAGGFIYIAMVHLIPQLKNSGFKQTASELFLFIVGISLMYLMGILE